MLTKNLLLALVLCLSLVSAAHAADEAKAKTEANAKKTDQELIQGTWEVVGRVKNGQSEDVKEKPVTLTFANDSMTEFKAGEKKAVGGFTLDPATAPKRITMTGKEGDHAGATFEGIYDLSGDKLKIAYGVRDPKTPPKDFSGGEGSGLLVLERKKDDKQASADEKLIQGNWKLLAMVRNGKAMTEQQLKEQSITWQFDGKHATMTRGSRKNEAAYVLDTAKKHIAITPKEAVEEGKGMTGLYELKGDTLKIAFRIGSDAKTPPEDVTQGEGLGMMAMERQKEQKD